MYVGFPSRSPARPFNFVRPRSPPFAPTRRLFCGKDNWPGKARWELECIHLHFVDAKMLFHKKNQLESSIGLRDRSNSFVAFFPHALSHSPPLASVCLPPPKFSLLVILKAFRRLLFAPVRPRSPPFAISRILQIFPRSPPFARRT